MNTPTALTIQDQQNPEAIIQIVLDGLNSDNSRRAYRQALTDFMDWYERQSRPGLNKATVQRYKAELQSSGLAASSINQRMSAIRKLAQEAADNGLLDQTLANGVSAVHGVKAQGVRSGNWLTKEQAQNFNQYAQHQHCQRT